MNRSQPLPANPSLESDRKRAKALLKAVRARDAEAVAAFGEHHPRYGAAPDAAPDSAKLADAQLVVARRYGFASWPQWKQFVDTRRLDRAAQASALVEAVCSDDVRKARVLLDADPGLARFDLATACACGEIDAVREALARDPGAANRKSGPKQWEPLQYACFSRFLRAEPARTGGIVAAVAALLDAGADPNVYHEVQWEGTPWRETPLFGAAGIANHAGLTRRLLDAGADIHEGNAPPDPADPKGPPWGPEALYHASESPDPACLALLLDAGPYPFCVSYCLGRSLDFARRGAHVRLYVEHGADPNFRVPWNGGRTHLQKAVTLGRAAETVSLLLDHGGDPDATDDHGVTTLGFAVRYGHGDLADLLTARGADPGRVTDADRRLAGAWRGQKVEGEWDAAARGYAGDALCLAVQRNDLPGLGNLLDAGLSADAMPPADTAFNALHHACWRGRAEAVDLLLRHGADPNHVSGYGSNTLGSAIHGSFNCFDPEGGPMMAGLSEELSAGDYAAIAERLLAAGATPPKDIWGGADAVQDVLRRHGVPEPAES